QPRIKVPSPVKRGEVIEIRTLIRHPMESGYVRDSYGKLIPRNIITQFFCELDGHEVFRADLDTPTAANPYLSFHLRAEQSGTLTFTWVDEHGEELSETRALEVT
ncbi:MAG: thiosulfate oxidation carrier complex protein SoxZ, partial [Pseudomonadota bacterium]